MKGRLGACSFQAIIERAAHDGPKPTMSHQIIMAQRRLKDVGSVRVAASAQRASAWRVSKGFG